VVVQLARRQLGVVGHAGGEDALVLGAALGQRAAVARRQREPVALRALPQRRDELEQPARLGGAVEREVELGVGRQRVDDRAAAVRAHVTPQRLARLALVLGGETLGGVRDGQRLEREPQLVDLAQVLDAQLPHARAAVGHVLDQAVGVEAAQRLADRHRAHLQRVGELLDRQPLARGDAAGDDRLVQHSVRLLGQRPVAGGGLEACGRGGRHARKATGW